MAKMKLVFVALSGFAALSAAHSAAKAQASPPATSETERAWVECLQTNARQLNDTASDAETVARKVVENCDKAFSDLVRAGCIPLQPVACESYTRMLSAGRLGVATHAVRVFRSSIKPRTSVC
jgi:hypothetical protein